MGASGAGPGAEARAGRAANTRVAARMRWRMASPPGGGTEPIVGKRQLTRPQRRCRQYPPPMDPQTNSRALPAGWTFFRQWLKNPLRVAAISPSSRQLARQMMTQLPRTAKRVIELGGGTGVFTQALADHGIEAADMLVLELNEELHQHLVRQFPHA